MAGPISNLFARIARDIRAVFQSTNIPPQRDDTGAFRGPGETLNNMEWPPKEPETKQSDGED